MIPITLTNQLLRDHWRALRRFRSAGTVLVDYRILKNYAHRLIKQELKP